MKKILAFVISLVLTLSMLCCGATAEVVDVTGEWYGDVFCQKCKNRLKYGKQKKNECKTDHDLLFGEG